MIVKYFIDNDNQIPQIDLIKALFFLL